MAAVVVVVHNMTDADRIRWVELHRYLILVAVIVQRMNVAHNSHPEHMDPMLFHTTMVR